MGIYATRVFECCSLFSFWWMYHSKRKVFFPSLPCDEFIFDVFVVRDKSLACAGYLVPIFYRCAVSILDASRSQLSRRYLDSSESFIVLQLPLVRTLRTTWL
jgi:hypothetical protein